MSEAVRRPGTGLGRGLAALIPQRPTPVPTGTDIPIASVRRNRFQPRRTFDAAALSQLADSIRSHGVLQPIVVSDTGDGYELIAGERRLRAAQMAGLDRIPAVVREASDHRRLEMALIENVQRADLGPLEEAHAYRQLVDTFGLSQEDVASRVGRARSSVANTLRLLDLPAPIQQALEDATITEGHARAIATVPDPVHQTELLATVAARGLSVRQTEELGRRLRDGAAAPAVRRTSARTAATGDPELEHVEAELRTALGTKVSLQSSRRGGRIVIEYYDGDDLSRLFDRIVGVAQ